MNLTDLDMHTWEISAFYLYYAYASGNPDYLKKKLYAGGQTDRLSGIRNFSIR